MMVIYLISLSATVGLWLLGRRLAKQCESKPVAVNDPRVWLDSRDQTHFAGLWVAIDSDTNERVSAASHRQSVEHDLAVYHSERRCYLVRVPETESDEPIRVLFHFGQEVLS